MAAVAAGVTADPEPWRRATGETLSPLSETLARIPATRQERQYARTQLLFPAIAVLFALFWIASGVIGLSRLDAAARMVQSIVDGGGLAAGRSAGALVETLDAPIRKFPYHTPSYEISQGQTLLETPEGPLPPRGMIVG